MVSSLRDSRRRSIISSGLTEFVSKSYADSWLKLVGRTENVMLHLVRSDRTMSDTALTWNSTAAKNALSGQAIFLSTTLDVHVTSFQSP